MVPSTKGSAKGSSSTSVSDCNTRDECSAEELRALELTSLVRLRVELELRSSFMFGEALL